MECDVQPNVGVLAGNPVSWPALFGAKIMFPK